MSIRSLSILCLLGAALGGALLAPSWAEEPPEPHARPVDPLRQVALPFADLTVAATVRLTEGPRMLGDAFPYLAAAPTVVSGTGATSIGPTTLAGFLHAAPQEGGDVPARIRTGQAAIEAVRLFAAGPLVRDAETAERWIAAGRELANELGHLSVEIREHRPESWAPRALPLDQDKSRHPIEAWEVSIVVGELGRMLGLVHMTARVTADGEVTITRTPIVHGPMTAWQTKAVGEYTDEMERAEQARQAEAVLARRRYAQALRPGRDLDAFWAVGRARPDMDVVRAAFGDPDRDLGSGIHIWTYDLPDGTAVVFGGAPSQVAYIRHVRLDATGRRSFETLRDLYVMGR